MSNPFVDVVVVATSWSMSALLTLALATGTKPKETPKEEEKVVVTGYNHVAGQPTSASMQIFIIEKTLEAAEEDLEAIAKIIEQKKAEEAAKKLDAEEKGKGNEVRVERSYRNR